MYWEIRQARCHIMVVAFLVAVLGGSLSCRAAEQEQEPESGGETVVAIIHLRHRPAAGVLPAVRAALSPAGRASVDRVGNGIVVNDTADRVERIRTLVRGLDVRVPQVTVLLRSRSRERSGRRLSTTDGIRTPRPGLRLGHGTPGRETTLMLRLGSGSSGYLRFGRDIAVTRQWLALCGRYGFSYGWLSEYRRLESGFEVSVLVLDNGVELTLVPRITFGPEHAIRFAGAATRITVPVGIWVPVAVVSGSGRDATTFVLTGGDRAAATMVLEVFCRLDQG